MTQMTIALAIAGAPLVFGLALFRAAARGDEGLREMGLLEPTASVDAQRRPAPRTAAGGAVLHTAA